MILIKLEESYMRGKQGKKFICYYSLLPKGEHLLMLYRERVSQQECPCPIRKVKTIICQLRKDSEDYTEIGTKSIDTWQPRSPSPKIRSPSVTTITWMLLSPQFFNTSRILPLKNSIAQYFSEITSMGRKQRKKEWWHEKAYFSFKLI